MWCFFCSLEVKCHSWLVVEFYDEVLEPIMKYGGWRYVEGN